MSKETVFDFAVIGGGSAGYAAARTAVSEGLSTVVIDGAEELGGLCILRGCMPSKTLIESANRALTIRRAGEFGLAATLTGVDTAFIRDRKRRLIAEFASYRSGQLEDGRFTLLRGHARFAGPHQLDVQLRDGGTTTIKARSMIIATGSSITWPAIPGLAEADPWTSDTILDAAELPESFLVLGGGAIALEMAHYLDGVGRQVTVIQRSGQVLTGMDADVAGAVEHALRERGLTLHTGTDLLRVERSAEGKSATFRKDGKEHTVHAAEILLALGRKPAVEGLALETAGVFHEGPRVAVTLTQQTAVPHIFAAGDVCGPVEVVHTAIQQGEVAARNAARLLRGKDEPMESIDYRLRLFGVFTHPQAAQVGMTEADAEASGRRWKSALSRFDDHGKSMVMGETEGFVKMIADLDSGEILGASAAGPEAVELIHQLVIAMHFHCTVQQFLTIPFYHPTLSEIWTYPAEELADEVPPG